MVKLKKKENTNSLNIKREHYYRSGDSKKVTRGYYEQLYEYVLENVEEISKFLVN